MRPKSEDYVVLSDWKGKSLSQIEYIGVMIGIEGIMNAISQDSYPKELIRKDSFFKDTTPAAIRDLDRYFGDLFVEKQTEGNNLYHLTSATAKVCFDDMSIETNSKKIDAITYSGVASKITGINMAFSTNFFDSNLDLQGAIIFRVTEHDDNRLHYSFQPVKALRKFGSLIWGDVAQDVKDMIWHLSPEISTVPFSEDMNIWV